MTTHRKAIVLLSGGLDSALAAKIIQEQGVEVIGLHLASPFGCRNEVTKIIEKLGIRLIVKEKGTAYLELVQNPKYGYGRAVNPCIDCRIFMFDLAEMVRKEENADFIVTGEVMGQRPMSQQKKSMELIDRKSESADRILRPLSAHLFEPSLPEREGWVNREALYNVSGRSRKFQIQLAEELNVTEFTAPGGGCLLTETSFASRLKDFFAFPHYLSAEEKLTQSELLRFGRHFRISDESKVIVSRNSGENDELKARWQKANCTLLTPIGFSGPVAMLLGKSSAPLLKTAGEMLLRYAKGKETENRVDYVSPEAHGSLMVDKAFNEEKMEEIRL